MAHLFTPKHRKLNGKDSSHELFHGHYAEKMYLIGMSLSAELKELENAIRFKRSSMATLRKNARRDDKDNLLYWQEVSEVRTDNRTLDSIRARLATVTEQLSVVKLNYQIAFLVSRDFSLKEIANVISWYAYKKKVDCGDPLTAAHIASEKIKTLEQMQRCGMRLNMEAAKAQAENLPCVEETSIDIEVEKTSPTSGRFVMFVDKGLGKS